MTVDDPILSTAEASAYFGHRIKAKTLANWRVEGRGPAYVQLSPRRIGYRLSALEIFARQAERSPTPATSAA